MELTDRQGTWIIRLIFFGPVLAFIAWALIANADNSDSEPQPVATPGPLPSLEWVHSPDAGYGDPPTGLLVDGEFWQECSYTNDVPPCWTYGVHSGRLYWPDGRITTF